MEKWESDQGDCVSIGLPARARMQKAIGASLAAEEAACPHRTVEAPPLARAFFACSRFRFLGFRVVLAAGGVLAAASAGCSAPIYAVYAAVSQLGVAFEARPIEQVLEDGILSEAQAAKVREILAMRDYAEGVLGLRVGPNYTTYLDTGGEPIAFSLTVAPADALEPLTWMFPFTGNTPYLLFYDRPAAESREAAYAVAGYDTYLYEVDAYSTMGLFVDPISTRLLSRSEASLANTLFHECAHNTVSRLGDSDFNENVATFLGRTGALRYLGDKYGADSDPVREARGRHEDDERYDRWTGELFAATAKHYADAGSSAERVGGREAVFAEYRRRFVRDILPAMNEPSRYRFVETLEINNAWLLVNARYTSDLGAFRAVYEATSRDWARSLRIFQDAAASADPMAHLRAAAGS